MINAMPKMKSAFFGLLFFCFCGPYYLFSQRAVIDFIDYRVDGHTSVDSNVLTSIESDSIIKADSGLIKMLQPYADSIGRVMNTVIGFSVRGLSKRQPESTLGNFMADCMKQMAEKKFNRKVDVAFVNYGGIRSYLPKGDVTIGEMYALMPFDNLIVLQEVKGNILKQFLDKIAARDGWPVSGLTMGIKNNQAVNIIIGNKQFSEKTTYQVANSDYIAGGGDGCVMLRGIYQTNANYLFRDALIEYVSYLTKGGNSIDAVTENRIVYDN
jgi:2',3'-cyclic-nucleotide 2'-phosphodiesterase (5'-nucleotidase family)